jgi:branched-chain amino acid transport system substrate-binding protein
VVADKLADDDKYKSLLMDYKKAFEARFGGSVSSFGGHAYDAFALFKAAYAKAGNDRTKLANALETITGMLGTAGEFNMSSTDHNGLSKEAAIMLEIKNGQFTPLK